MRILPRGAAALAALGAAALAVLLIVPRPGPAAETGPPPKKQAQEKAKQAARAAKANDRCYECHIDFKGEDLVADHEKAGVTCVRCHGHSQPHIDDEVRATPADVTFRKKAMRVFCLTCHDPATYRKGTMHAVEDAKPSDAKRRTCAQCHGDHVIVRLEEEEGKR
jgi:hypothetical protein